MEVVMTMTELQKQAVELTEHWTDIANEKYCLNLISPDKVTLNNGGMLNV